MSNVLSSLRYSQWRLVTIRFFCEKKIEETSIKFDVNTRIEPPESKKLTSAFGGYDNPYGVLT